MISISMENQEDVDPLIYLFPNKQEMKDVEFPSHLLPNKQEMDDIIKDDNYSQQI